MNKAHQDTYCEGLRVFRLSPRQSAACLASRGCSVSSPETRQSVVCVNLIASFLSKPRVSFALSDVTRPMVGRSWTVLPTKDVGARLPKHYRVAVRPRCIYAPIAVSFSVSSHPPIRLGRLRTMDCPGFGG